MTPIESPKALIRRLLEGKIRTRMEYMELGAHVDAYLETTRQPETTLVLGGVSAYAHNAVKTETALAPMSGVLVKGVERFLKDEVSDTEPQSEQERAYMTHVLGEWLDGDVKRTMRSHHVDFDVFPSMRYLKGEGPEDLLTAMLLVAYNPLTMPQRRSILLAAALQGFRCAKFMRKRIAPPQLFTHGSRLSAAALWLRAKWNDVGVERADWDFRQEAEALIKSSTEDDFSRTVVEVAKGACRSIDGLRLMSLTAALTAIASAANPTPTPEAVGNILDALMPGRSPWGRVVLPGGGHSDLGKALRSLTNEYPWIPAYFEL